jgi:nucleoside-diphosphate-sugar epimerase
MKVLVTGNDGYIGCQLSAQLLQRGHGVTGLDTGYYRNGWLYNSGTTVLPPCLNKDIRHIQESDLKGFDAVIHLAELSNDPLGQQNPAVTYQINHIGTVELAKKAIRASIGRFIYTSSCSVYGIGDGKETKTELSELNPQTAYAHCKVLVERDLSALASDNFTPTFLRNATAYGPSPRMRFDLVLNNLAGFAWTTKEIKMTSDGSPWRPLVHVSDIARAVICALEAPRQVVHNQIFNVGTTTENYQIRQIAEIVGDVFPNCKLSFGRLDGDNRSYCVNFDKIHADLPGFTCRWNARTGAMQLRQIFQHIDMPAEVFNANPYTRLKQLAYLLRTRQIDEDLYWSFLFNQTVYADKTAATSLTMNTI